jgi:hypothetical protein
VAIHFRHNLRIEAQTRDVVVHLHLMLKYHQGGDVTRWAQVLAGVEKPAEVSIRSAEQSSASLKGTLERRISRYDLAQASPARRDISFRAENLKGRLK